MAKNIIDMVNKIELIVDNYKNIYSNCITKCNKFSWKFICDKYKSIYLKILENIVTEEKVKKDTQTIRGNPPIPKRRFYKQRRC